jgi:glycolate oxidase
MMNEGIKQALIGIVGEKNYTDSLVDMVSYSKDASEFKHRPDAAVWATSTEEISSILKLANKEKFPVTARGAGTSLSGLSVPERGGVILDLGRMNKIIRISIEDRLAVVQPGVVYASLEKALTPYGFFFPPDPASGIVSTLGGNVACNAGGIKGAKYGTTKDYVMALEVVLPDGRVMHTGSNCMKSVSGYDLTKLFVGSEGTLGVITEITLKINPKPPRTLTTMATFDDLEDAGRAVTEIMHSGIVPSALEIVDQQTIIALNQNADLNLPEVEAILVAETDGYTEDETEFQLAKVMDIFKKNNASTIKRASSAEEAETLWTARKTAYGVMSRVNTNLFVEDLSVPISKMPDILRAVSDVAKKYDLKIPTVGHAGDGNLHPTISFDGTNPEEVERVEKASEDIYDKVIGMGGTLTGEHGIGLAKARFMPLEHDEVNMDVMRGIKKLFDPNNILNPGKMALDDTFAADSPR